MRRVVVTGIGLCTPLGVGVHNVWTKLLEGASGIVNVPQTEDYVGIPSQVVGLVPKGSGEDEFQEGSVVSSSERRTMSLASVYAIYTAGQALKDAKWYPKTDSDQLATGVAIGSIMPGVQDIISAGKLMEEGKRQHISPYLIPNVLSNLPAGHVSMRFGLKGPNHSVSTACTTGLHAIGDGAAMIARGMCDVMVAGGTEACIYPVSIAGFCRAKAISTKFNAHPKLASRPFDSERDGLVLSEGSGVVVLEELQHALNRNASIYGEILGYGLSGDAHHITAPPKNGDGAMRCMTGAMRDAKISLQSVGHINAHATSTVVGDAVENAAIKNVFQEHSKNLLISSNKGAIGHLLGAAGSVEAIITILSVHNGIVPPTLNINELTPEFDLNYCANEPVEWNGEKQRIALTNSFGFGGTNASLCIGQYVD